MAGDDTSVALLRFQNGAIGTLGESFLMKSLATADEAEVHTLLIDGDLGSVIVGADRRIRLYSERPEYQLGGPPVAYEPAIPEADTFARELAHFLDVIRTEAAPVTSGRSQRILLACVLAAYRSMDTGLRGTIARPARHGAHRRMGTVAPHTARRPPGDAGRGSPHHADARPLAGAPPGQHGRPARAWCGATGCSGRQDSTALRAGA